MKIKYFIFYLLVSNIHTTIYPSKGITPSLLPTHKTHGTSAQTNSMPAFAGKPSQTSTLQKYALQAKKGIQTIGQKLGFLDGATQAPGLQMQKNPLTANQQAAIKVRNFLQPIGKTTGTGNAGVIDFLAGTKNKNIDKTGNVIETFTPSAENKGLQSRTIYIQPMKSKKGLEVISAETYDPQFTQGLRKKFVDKQGTTYEKFDPTVKHGLRSKVTAANGTSTKFYEPLLSKQGLQLEQIQPDGTKFQKFDPLFSTGPRTKVTYPQKGVQSLAISQNS